MLTAQEIDRDLTTFGTEKDPEEMAHLIESLRDAGLRSLAGLLAELHKENVRLSEKVDELEESIENDYISIESFQNDYVTWDMVSEDYISKEEVNDHYTPNEDVPKDVRPLFDYFNNKWLPDQKMKLGHYIIPERIMGLLMSKAHDLCD